MIKLDLPTEKEFLGMIDDGIIKSINNSDYDLLTMYNTEHLLPSIWLKNGKYISYVNNSFSISRLNNKDRLVSIMPVIRNRKIVKEAINRINDNSNIVYLEKYYPLFVANKQVNQELDERYSNNELIETELVFNNRQVYYYNGKIYIRILIIESVAFLSLYKSDYEILDYAWVELQDVPWILDQKRKILVSQYSLNNSNRSVSVREKLSIMSIDFSKNIINRQVYPLIREYKRQLISDNIVAHMIMNKQNLNVDDFELNNQNELVLRR